MGVVREAMGPYVLGEADDERLADCGQHPPLLLLRGIQGPTVAHSAKEADLGFHANLILPHFLELSK